MSEIFHRSKEVSRLKFGTAVPFEEAVASLSTDNPIIKIDVKRSGSRTDVVWNGKRGSALLSFGGVYAYGYDLQTGNFVPEGEEPPDGVPAYRRASEPGFKLRFYYAFDTDEHHGIYDCIKGIEDAAARVEGFNPKNLPRREWQDGRHDEKYFSMTMPVVTKYNAMLEYHGKRAKYPVHDWISRLIHHDPRWVPNPDRPVYMEALPNGGLRDLMTTKSPSFHPGDVLWFSFTFNFWFGKSEWGVDLRPVQFIRVGRLAVPEASPGSIVMSVEPDVARIVQDLRGTGSPSKSARDHVTADDSTDSCDSDTIDGASTSERMSDVTVENDDVEGEGLPRIASLQDDDEYGCEPEQSQAVVDAGAGGECNMVVADATRGVKRKTSDASLDVRDRRKRPRRVGNRRVVS